MDDLISRRAAIYIASGYCHPENIAKELRKLQAAQPVPQWIPVTERLPENKQPCLLTIGYGGKLYCDISIYSTDLYTIDKYDFADKHGKSGWYYRDSEYGYCEHTGVLAWMPLPEPYSRKEGEK